MKTQVLLIIILLIICASCEKPAVAPELKRKTEEKLLGRWMLERTVEEIYAPISSLNSLVEYIGTNGDFYVFKANQFAEINSLQTGRLDMNYEVYNPYQLMIENTLWRIEKLTINELHLVLDKNDASTYKRYVTRVYLKK